MLGQWRQFVMDVQGKGMGLWSTTPMRILPLTLLLLLSLSLNLDACEYGAPISGPVECVTFKPEDLENVTSIARLPQRGLQYYRYLLLHNNYLIVGAKNYLLTLKKKNISETHKVLEDFPGGGDYASSCQAWGIIVDPDCQNHIHFVTPNTTYSDSDIVYVCGTGGYNPTGFLYNVTSGSKVQSYEIPYGNAKAICPYDPFDNTTALYVTKGNPENLPALYSAANVDFTKARPLIYRGRMFYPNGSLAYGSLKTAQEDAKWLNEPQFVGSFDMEDVVYFFFREEALEHSHSCGKKIYSRVARVCKNDKGGPNVVKGMWMSYQKARLNCSMPGKIQYYFNEIQDIRWDAAKKTFYALFTTSSYGVTGSAICAYSVDAIEAAFEGPFQDPSDGSPIPESEVPTPRPGRCADIPDSTKVSRSFVTFINEKTLMYSAVQHKFEKPIFMRPNVMLQKLQAHFFPSDNLLFAGSNDGHVYQIFQPTTSKPETLISAVISPLRNSGPVWSMQYDEDHGMLYVGYDNAVVQVALRGLCEIYDKADSCTFNRFCGWANSRCLVVTPQECSETSYGCVSYCELAKEIKNHPEKADSVWEDLLNIFVGRVNPKEKTTSSGQLVTMEISLPLCTAGSIHWHYAPDCKNLSKIPRSQHLLGADNSLTIRNTTNSDEGCYAAKTEEDRYMAYYKLTVHTDDSEKERFWEAKFYEWCDAFEDYKNNVLIWKNSCEGGISNSNTIPKVPHS